jgi:hypothetical protein
MEPSHIIQKGRPKRPKDAQPTRTKERRELIPLMVGSYFTHNLSNVTHMQIMTSNSNRKSRTNIFYQCNLPLHNKGKNMLKSNTNTLLEKLNEKRQG